MTYDRPGTSSMTEVELMVIAREAVPLDPSDFPEHVTPGIRAFNRRVRLLQDLLGRASAVLQGGAPIGPELARTIRIAVSGIHQRRARLLNGLERADS